MEMTATIREQMEEFLHKNEMTINRFAEISEVNSGTLSNILNGNRPISMQQLDRITAGMGLEEGYFYELYIDECIFHATPDWRRLGPFLHRCADLGKLDCLDKAVRMTMDNISYSPLLFETAEVFFREGKHEAAVLLYKSVAESERFQHSERLALCQYRLFTLELGDDQEVNSRAAVYFEPYIDRLDEVYQLDALRELINLNVSLNRWNKVDELTDKMGRIASIQYQYEVGMFGQEEERSKPIVFYKLYSHLIKATVYYERGAYDLALKYVSMYSDPEWLKNESNEEELRIIKQFSEWAEANRYLYKLMAGNDGALSEYVKYITDKEDEIFLAICNIMIAANRYQLQVDHILEKFKSYIGFKKQKNHIGVIFQQITVDRYTRLLAELGIYYLNLKQFDKGLELILDSLEKSIAINSDSGMLRCMGLFEQFRSFSTLELQQRYRSLVCEVQKLNDKKIGLSVSY
ncbi:transcriptional regulator [Paenibacillus glucanolyticus]|uniref:Transcriptional regulator n=1 Tax=Paenibacillus glucanolyticus TaxID=59843 RepID=A0A163G042_9BACL|nr:helix-turn-helix transcriptional regulator [Paenibacillus glucanolyticus]KZS44661.1 transcriptional regulator [Paenibacillus glucanolyticus]MPY18257.1 helix-turn-helix transcriptional regulator [Paenibacillus glucanolyticus]